MVFGLCTVRIGQVNKQSIGWHKESVGFGEEGHGLPTFEDYDKNVQRTDKYSSCYDNSNNAKFFVSTIIAFSDEVGLDYENDKPGKTEQSVNNKLWIAVAFLTNICNQIVGERDK
jgi:hypothetical protein